MGVARVCRVRAATVTCVSIRTRDQDMELLAVLAVVDCVVSFDVTAPKGTLDGGRGVWVYAVWSWSDDGITFEVDVERAASVHVIAQFGALFWFVGVDVLETEVAIRNIRSREVDKCLNVFIWCRGRDCNTAILWVRSKCFGSIWDRDRTGTRSFW